MGGLQPGRPGVRPGVRPTAEGVSGRVAGEPAPAHRRQIRMIAASASARPRAVLVLLLALLVGACSPGAGSDGTVAGPGTSTTAPEAPATTTTIATTTTTAPGGGDGAAGLAGRVWQVVGVVEADVVQPPPPGVTATLQVEDGRISGSAGCNSYSAQAVIEGSSLRVGAISVTERACADTVDWFPFLDALSQATSFEAVGDGYVVRAGPNGAIVLR